MKPNFRKIIRSLPRKRSLIVTAWQEPSYSITTGDVVTECKWAIAKHRSHLKLWSYEPKKFGCPYL